MMQVSAIQLEQEWVQKTRQGDDYAFKLLYERYHQLLFRNICYKTYDQQLAQDVIQDTFLKVWIKRRALNPDKSFFSYLVTIGQRLLYDHFKHHKVQEKWSSQLQMMADGQGSNPHSDLSNKLLTQKIRKVVNAKLPEKCRTIFLLSRLGQHSNSEIAAILKISKKTVENQLVHALKILRKHCKDYL